MNKPLMMVFAKRAHPIAKKPKAYAGPQTETGYLAGRPRSQLAFAKVGHRMERLF